MYHYRFGWTGEIGDVAVSGKSVCQNIQHVCFTKSTSTLVTRSQMFIVWELLFNECTFSVVGSVQCPTVPRTTKLLLMTFYEKGTRIKTTWKGMKPLWTVLIYHLMIVFTRVVTTILAGYLLELIHSNEYIPLTFILWIHVYFLSYAGLQKIFKYLRIFISKKIFWQFV